MSRHIKPYEAVERIPSNGRLAGAFTCCGLFRVPGGHIARGVPSSPLIATDVRRDGKQKDKYAACRDAAA